MFRALKSFKTRLLVITVSGYVILWFTFLLVTSYTLREHSRELFDEQQRWLGLYLTTCISDLRTGNSLALTRKLKNLVSDKMFSEVEITAGGFHILQIRAEDKKSRPNFLTRWVLVKMIPRDEIHLDVRDEYSTDWGMLRARLDGGILAEQIERNLIIYIRVGAGLFLILLGGILLAIRKETQPLVEITDYINRFTHRGTRPEELETLLAYPLVFSREEWSLLGNAFKGAIQSLLKLEQQVRQKNIDAELSKVAIQVAHDIRNPLAVIATAASLPDGTSQSKIAPLLQGAAKQISSIADELLRKYRGVKAASQIVPANESVGPELVAAHLEFSISSVQLQAKNQPLIDWSFEIMDKDVWIFSNVNGSKFRRVLTILLQNAVESISTSGKISVRLAQVRDQWVVITINDSGEGMDAQSLKRVMEGVAVSSKKEGNALGVRYALATLIRWGGKLEYESTRGLGTTARVILPAGPTPDWLFKRLSLASDQEIVILDDNPIFQETWRQRFLTARPAQLPTIRAYQSAPELNRWRSEHPERSAKALYLIDYDLGTSESGLAFIIREKLAHQAVLVTAREKDFALFSQAEHVGVKVLPKYLVSWVPIKSRKEVSDAF